MDRLTSTTLPETVIQAMRLGKELVSRMRLISVPLMALGTFVMIFAGCGSSIEISSHWKSGTTPADPALTTRDWALTQVPDQPVLVGFSNDDSTVTVYLIAQNREMARRIVFSGMTLWFDPEGGSKQHFGVHYPVGMAGGREAFMQRDENPPENGDPEAQFSERSDALMKSSLANVELLGPGKYDRETCSILQLKGMTINVRDEDQRFIYELRIPMKQDAGHPYAIGRVKDSDIGILIKTGAAPGNRQRSEMSGERPGGGEGGGRGEFPGGGGGRGGGRGRGSGRGGGQRPEAVKPLDINIDLHLAKSQQASTEN